MNQGLQNPPCAQIVHRFPVIDMHTTNYG